MAKPKSKLFSIDNIIGVLLAILIIFDLKIERPIINLINTPIGIIFSLIFVIILFIYLNPIIGILFLIYIFINIKETKKTSKNNILQNLNPPQEMQVEEEVILNNAPIKNQNKGNNVSFKPVVEKLQS
jgi:predicted membrane protein